MALIITPASGSSSSTTGTGDINFITNGGGTSGTSGYTAGSYSAASRPSGTFTASSGSSAFELSTTTLNPLGISGTSLTFTKYAGASRQGRAIEYEFNLPTGYRGKVLTISNQYIVNSGTFVAGTNSTDSSMIFYTAFYDGSTWTIQEPSSFKLLSNSSVSSDVFSATVQTPYNATKMKLIAYVAETANSSWEVKANLQISPSQYVYGTPITDWQSYTPTITGTSLLSSSFKYRRVGDSIQIQGVFVSNVANGSNLTLSLPSGLTIDSTKADNGTGYTYGDAIRGTSAATTRKRFKLLANSGTGNLVYFTNDDYTTGVSPFAGIVGTSAISGGDTVLVQINNLPILGWSSSNQMTDQTDTRVVSFSAFKSGGNQNGSSGVVSFTSAQDSHGAFNLAAGTFTIPVAGDYQFTAAHEWTATQTVGFGIFVNGTISGGYSSGASSFYGNISAFVKNLKAGDVISVRSTTGSVLNLANFYFSGFRISGPSAIAATESNRLRYSTTAGQSVANASATILTFATKSFDTHGQWTGSNTFNAQISGKYRAKVQISVLAPNTTGNTSYIRILVNGSTVSEKPYTYSYVSGSYYSYDIEDEYDLLAGQTIQFAFFSNHGAATTVDTNPGRNYFVIERMGN